MKSPLSILVAVFVVSIFVSYTLQVFAEASPAVNLSNTSGESRRVQIFVEGQNVYTVWTDDTPGNSDVFFAKSINGGATFEDAINLSNNNGSSAFPRLVVSEPNVYVVWYDYSPGQSDIFFGKSDDRGKSFHTINIKTPDPSYNPWIASWSNYVYLVWNDGGRTTTIELPGGESRIVDVTTGDEEIFFGVSKDEGETFEFSNLSNSPDKMSWNARIRSSGPNVFVVWNEMTGKESDIIFSASSDNGNNFSTPINVSNDTRESSNAGIAVSENNIYLIWNQETQDSTDIFYAKSAYNGITFSEPINLSNSTGVAQIGRDTQIAVSGSNVFIVWYEDFIDYSDIFFTRSIDGGLTFSKPINLSQTNSKSEFPQIAANKENVFVIWHDYSQGNGDIFFRESTDSGATFGSIRNLSNDAEESNIFVLGPQLFLAENRVYTVWQNMTENSSDLFLTSFAQNEKQGDGQILLSTLNDAAKIELKIDRKKPEVNRLTNFTLRFFDPEDSSLLNDVNYSFKISDYTGETVINLENQFTQTGVDTHPITFSQEGPFTVLIEIQGTGIDKPFDTKYSGIASATITVVPEFSMNVILSMAAMTGLVVAFTTYQKLKLSSLWKKI